MHRNRRAKIVATLGPASGNEAEIRALMDAPALAVSARGRAPVVWGAIKAAL